MTNDPIHPVPTERRVLVTALDQKLIKVPLETLLRDRGIDPVLPYRTEAAPDDATLYIQAIPPPEGP